MKPPSSLCHRYSAVINQFLTRAVKTLHTGTTCQRKCAGEYTQQCNRGSLFLLYSLYKRVCVAVFVYAFFCARLWGTSLLLLFIQLVSKYLLSTYYKLILCKE